MAAGLNVSVMSELDPVARRQRELEQSRTRRSMRDRLRDLRDDEVARSDPQRLNQLYMGPINREEYIDGIQTTGEGKLDAQIFKQVADIHRAHTETIDTNDRRFIPTEFAALLGRDMLSVPMEDGVVRANAKEWRAFGRNVAHLFKGTPHLSFMLGAFDTEEKEKEKVVRRKAEPKSQQQKSFKAATKVTETAVSRSEEERVELIVKSIFKQLEAECAKADGGRVGYFQFALDPADFGQSVENMFHISFLVKQRMVLLSDLDNTGLPTLEILSPPASAGGPARKSPSGAVDDGQTDQMIVVMNKGQWADLCRLLKIKTAKIKLDPETIRKTTTEEDKRKRRRRI